jgi:hypothetical protein
MMEGPLILAMITQRFAVTGDGPAAVPRLSSTLKPRDSIFVNLSRRQPMA